MEYAGTASLGTRLVAETVPGVSGTGIFSETIAAPPALIICGAGDDAQPLARMALETGWHVTVADTRAAYATPERFAGVDKIMAAPVGEIAASLRPDARTFVVVMTHRYADDLAWLRTLLPRDFAYLGLLGPRPRTDGWFRPEAWTNRARALFRAAFSLAIRTEGASMSVPTVTGVRVRAAAIASTPVPQPTSSTRPNRRRFKRWNPQVYQVTRMALVVAVVALIVWL